MIRYVFILLTILCFACSEHKKHEFPLVESQKKESKQEYKAVIFDEVTLSVFCFCRGWNTKDVEIYSDGSIFYRVRDYWNVGENYAGKLDSAGMVEIKSFLSSIDFNSLKSGPHMDEDAAYHSIQFVLPEGEVVMKGNLEFEESLKVYQLLKFVDTLKLPTSKNRHFITARDVPPLPTEEFKPKDYNKLLDSL